MDLRQSGGAFLEAALITVCTAAASCLGRFVHVRAHPMFSIQDSMVSESLSGGAEIDIVFSDRRETHS